MESIRFGKKEEKGREIDKDKERKSEGKGKEKKGIGNEFGVKGQRRELGEEIDTGWKSEGEGRKEKEIERDKGFEWKVLGLNRRKRREEKGD